MFLILDQNTFNPLISIFNIDITELNNAIIFALSALYPLSACYSFNFQRQILIIIGIFMPWTRMPDAIFSLSLSY